MYADRRRTRADLQTLCAVFNPSRQKTDAVRLYFVYSRYGQITQTFPDCVHEHMSGDKVPSRQCSGGPHARNIRIKQYRTNNINLLTLTENGE